MASAGISALPPDKKYKLLEYVHQGIITIIKDNGNIYFTIFGVKYDKVEELRRSKRLRSQTVEIWIKTEAQFHRSVGDRTLLKQHKLAKHNVLYVALLVVPGGRYPSADSVATGFSRIRSAVIEPNCRASQQLILFAAR
jgi:hypothetical protein